MNTHVDQIQESTKQSFANEGIQKKNSSEPTTQFVDNSPEAKEAAQLQAMADNSPEAKQMAQLQEMADNNPEAEQTAQLQSIADSSPEAKEAAKLQAMADEHGAQEEQPKQQKVNNTGLPDDLKTGIENLSGFSMDDVKVHYNSSKPAELQAHAYAEGTDIYIGPGQEEHLPHEAWHVVQQKQGRVKPTLQMEGGVDVNDDKGLEKEADVMGGKALQMKSKEKKNRAVLNSIPQKKKKKKTQLVKIQLNEEEEIDTDELSQARVFLFNYINKNALNRKVMKDLDRAFIMTELEIRNKKIDAHLYNARFLLDRNNENENSMMRIDDIPVLKCDLKNLNALKKLKDFALKNALKNALKTEGQGLNSLIDKERMKNFVDIEAIEIIVKKGEDINTENIMISNTLFWSYLAKNADIMTNKIMETHSKEFQEIRDNLYSSSNKIKDVSTQIDTYLINETRSVLKRTVYEDILDIGGISNENLLPSDNISVLLFTTKDEKEMKIELDKLLKKVWTRIGKDIRNEKLGEEAKQKLYTLLETPKGYGRTLNTDLVEYEKNT